MSFIQATLALYRDCGLDAGRALARGWWSTAFLFGACVAFVVAALAMSPFGLAGSFAVSLFEAFLIGWYLSLVEIGVVGRRRVTFADVRDNVGSLFSETISVLFLFSIPLLIISLTWPELMVVVVPVLSLVFNPVPETIYLDRRSEGPVDQVLGAARFMQQNWPEWMGIHLVVGGLLALWDWFWRGGDGVESALMVLRLFGPFFDFVNVGGLAMQIATVAGGLVGAVSFAGTFAVVHGFLIFRGHLFLRLNKSSRRSRAWSARNQG
jgi:hypothetical protein